MTLNEIRELQEAEGIKTNYDLNDRAFKGLAIFHSLHGTLDGELHAEHDELMVAHTDLITPDVARQLLAFGFFPNEYDCWTIFASM